MKVLALVSPVNDPEVYRVRLCLVLAVIINSSCCQVRVVESLTEVDVGLMGTIRGCWLVPNRSPDSSDAELGLGLGELAIEVHLLTLWRVWLAQAPMCRWRSCCVARGWG